MKSFKTLNHISRCLENHTCDMNVCKSIPIDEEDDVKLKYLTIFYPIILSWTLTHEDVGILSMEMEARILSLYMIEWQKLKP